MQFRIKNLFAAMFIVALLATVARIAIDRRPQVSAPILLVLSAPALLGFGLLVFSFVMTIRYSASEHAVTKYKSLAGIGAVAVMPLAAYFTYCCIVSSQ